MRPAKPSIDARGLPPEPPARRVVLSALAVALLAGCESLVPRADKPTLGATEDDVALLGAALALEYDAIAAYEAGLVSGLARPPAQELARRFRDDHARHAEALVGAIVRLGGRPAEGSGRGPPAASLAGEADLLRFAASLEQGLALMYLGAVPAFADRDLAKAAAGIMGVETMHWAALRALLGEPPVPAPFFG
jgi:hypothetical protein